MFVVLAQTGMRKAEVSLHEKADLDKSCLLMSNVAWRINGVYYAAPARQQLKDLRTGDYALLTPAPMQQGRRVLQALGSCSDLVPALRQRREEHADLRSARAGGRGSQEIDLA